MNKIKLDKGITLIALIITIIVLLILAVVAIAAVNDGGIIDYAQNATNSYNDEKSKEEDSILGYEDFIEESLYGKENTETGPTSITISGPDTAKTGEKISLSAYDQNGNILYRDDITWSAVSGVTIENSSGMVYVTSTDTGTIKIKATSKSDSSIYAEKDIEITKAGPTSIRISGPSSGTEVGEMIILRAYDQNGEKLYTKDIVWSAVSGVEISTGSTNDVNITSTISGTIQVKATSRYDESVYAVYYINIKGGDPTSITISGPSSMQRGEKVYLVAYDQNGNVLYEDKISWYTGTSGAAIEQTSGGVYVSAGTINSVTIRAISKSDSSILAEKRISVSN